MKKRLLLLIGIILASSLALVACGGGGGGADAEKNFIGTWKLISIDGEDDYAASEADIAMLEEMGFTQEITLKEDKTALFVIVDESVEGTWAAKDASTASLTIEGDTVEMKIVDGTLKLSSDGMTMNFVKSDKAAATTSKDDASKDDESKDTTKDESKDATKDDNKSKDSDASDGESMNLVVADDDICTITITGKTLDWGSDPGYEMTIVNNTYVAIYVSYDWGSFSVNGKMVSPWFSATVQPGKYVETVLSFSSSDIGEGIESLVNVEGFITVDEADTWDDLAKYEINIP